ncbi:MAG: entericidin [Verrucomicrobiales bacterium]|nr:entericidin [Verrucomicrobiales bacterium]MCP5560523.1 hypothetical protein [Verrucomicrobiaceae bacterium]
MKTFRLLTLLSLGAVLLTLSSCRTMRGLGSDVQHLGSRIEEKAEQTSPY